MSAHLSDRQRAATEVLTGWTPERLLQTWIDEIGALGIAPENLVETLALPAASERLAWCPRAQLSQLRLGLGTPADASQSGLQQTLQYLLEARGDATASAAVLLGASLFARIERARSRYPREAWPPFAAAQCLLAWTRTHKDYRWPSDCDATLPAHLAEDGLVLGSLQQLVRFLAVEHARVLHQLAPVQLTREQARTSLVTYTRTAPPLEPLGQSLPAPSASIPAPLHSMSVPRDPARRRDPRWAVLTRGDLEALIWSMPQREVAREFGVSEATVAKRCKVLEIAKPERGFWQRSRAAAAR